MKKILAFMLAAALSLSLTACGGGADKPTASPDEIPSEEVSAPQETEKPEESTVVPTEEVSDPVEPSPTTGNEDSTKESSLFDEDGNAVSIEEFLDHYQLNLFLYRATGKLYTIEKPEDSTVLYYFYEHENADSAGEQTSTCFSFSNHGEVVGADGAYNNIILLSTLRLEDEDALTLYMAAATELMHFIDPSVDESIYLQLVNDSMAEAVKSSDGKFIIGGNDVTYTFSGSQIGSGFYMLGVGAEF